MILVATLHQWYSVIPPLPLYKYREHMYLYRPLIQYTNSILPIITMEHTYIHSVRDILSYCQHIVIKSMLQVTDSVGQ